MTLLQKISSGLRGWLARRLPDQSGTLRAWREKAFFYIFLCALLLGAPALAASVKMAADYGYWGHAAFYVAFFLLTAAAVFVPGIGYRPRAWTGVLIFFVYGAVALLTLGPVGSGRPWFFASAVVASLLLGLRAALATLFAIAAGMFAVGWLMEAGLLKWPLLDFYSAKIWNTTSFTTLLVAGVSAVSVALLVDVLGKALDKQRAGNLRLEEANAALREEMAIRLRAEEDLHRYRDNLEEAVRQRTASLAEANLALRQEVEARSLAEEALRGMASGVSHNFNNALMAITSNAQAAQAVLSGGDGGQGDAAELLDNVVRASLGAKQMLGRLENEFVAAPAGQAGAAVDLGELLRSLASIAGNTFPALKSARASLAVEAPHGLMVQGVRGELFGVFLNLIKNALEASPGGASLSMTGSARGGWAVVRVSDDGPGMDQRTLSRIFEPFFTTKGEWGKGLGLASSLEIVKSHGGDITVESHPGQGATFEVLLPLAALPARRPPEAVSGQPDRRGDLLLVEDEALVAMGLAAILEKAGYQVEQAASAEQAMARLERRLPEIIICDLGLPGASGWQVIRAARRKAAKEGHEAPLAVVLTGWSERRREAECPADIAPAPLVLQKPVEKGHLLAVLDRGQGPASAPA